MAARRTRGDGSVFFDAARGCWVGTVDVGRDERTGRRVRRKVSAPTRDECRDKLDELRDEKRKTGTVAPRNITVAAVVAALMASPPAEWKAPMTFTVNEALAARITRTLGSIRLTRLTPGDVERKLLAPMAAEGMATGTMSACKGLLARAIRRAQRDNLVIRNVAELADTPAGTRKVSKSMTLEQIGKLFGSDLTPWWRAYLLTGILCGLRPGELTGLQWDDVDFGASVIRVRHSLKEVPGKPTTLALESLKTDRSRRTLQLPGKVADALRQLRAVQAADRLRLGPHYGSMNLVFCSPAGRPLRRQAVGKGFRRVCNTAGLGTDWHPHEQRHTFVSVLSDAGVDIEAIADAAGHINSNVTRTVYRHQISPAIARAAAEMDRIFGA